MPTDTESDSESRILDPRQIHPAAAVWGLTIDAEHMCKEFDKSRGLTKLRETDQVAWEKALQEFDDYVDVEYLQDLKEKCRAIFDPPYPITVTPVVDYRAVGDYESKEVDCIYVLIMATRPDDKLLPSADVIEKLTAMAEPYGFEWSVGWFVEHPEVFERGRR